MMEKLLAEHHVDPQFSIIFVNLIKNNALAKKVMKAYFMDRALRIAIYGYLLHKKLREGERQMYMAGCVKERFRVYWSEAFLDDRVIDFINNYLGHIPGEVADAITDEFGELDESEVTGENERREEVSIPKQFTVDTETISMSGLNKRAAEEQDFIEDKRNPDIFIDPSKEEPKFESIIINSSSSSEEEQQMQEDSINPIDTNPLLKNF